MPFARLRLALQRFGRRLWVTPAAYALGTLAMLWLAALLEPLVPAGVADLVPRAAIEQILGILGSSMLAVAIFSLGTMVSALEAAAAAATPRARPLITADRTARNAIATFIGGFIFAIMSLIGISGGGFDGAGRVVIFVFTIVVILFVIVTLIAWIDRLSQLGGVAESIALVETAGREAFAALAARPWLGGTEAADPATMEPAPEGTEIRADRFGFIQMVDGARLGHIADTAGTGIVVLGRSGDYVDSGSVLAVTERPLDPATVRRIHDAFIVGEGRSFEDDPRFALTVLSEIAERALSPAVNDPGTAIEAIGAAQRLIADWRAAAAEAEEKAPLPGCTRLSARAVPVRGILDAAFRRIAREGVRLEEVQIRLMQALGTLAARDPDMLAAPARALAEEALARAEGALAPQDNREVLRRMVARIGGTAHGAPEPEPRG